MTQWGKSRGVLLCLLSPLTVPDSLFPLFTSSVVFIQDAYMFTYSLAKNLLKTDGLLVTKTFHYKSCVVQVV